MATDSKVDPRSIPESFEVSLALMENRLRQQITELIQPTVQRTSMMLSDVDTLKSLVSTHTKGLQESTLGQFRVLEQVSTIAGFKEEMTRWDMQRRNHELSIDEKVETMNQRIDQYKYSLEQKESALHHLHRTVERAGAELNRLVEEQESQRDLFNDRLDSHSLRMNTLKTEIEVQVAALEMRHNALTDELWGEETGIAKVGGELRKTNFSLQRLEATVEELQRAKAEAIHLEKLRTDVSRMVHEANSTVAALKQTVGTVVIDVKEHFRTASQTISAHNAAFVNEVRNDYQEELKKSATLRGEVKEFMQCTDQGILVLGARVGDADRKAGALAGEVREEIEDLNRRRKRDKTSVDNELKTLKKRLGGVFDNSDMVLKGIEHIYGIIDMVLKSELTSCSVELQDSVDRKRIALIGTKDTDTALCRSNQTEPQVPRTEYRTKATSAYPKKDAGSADKPPVAGRQQDPVVRVDKRCLGCSGQSPLVLSAFKMACLQYTSSPVPFQGTLRDRDELLQERAAMLQKAQAYLSEGPRIKSSSAPGGGSGGGPGSPRAQPVSPPAASPRPVAASGGEDDGARGALSHYAAFDVTMASPRTQSVRLPGLPSTSGSAVAVN